MDLNGMAPRGITRRQLVKGGAALVAATALGSPGRALAHHAKPASGFFLAEGVAELPSDPFAWWLVRDGAPFAGDGAEMLERALGFAYAPQGMRMISADAGSENIEAGGAAFIPEGIFQRHVSQNANWVEYLRFGIVPPADSDYTAGGELLFGSAAFPAPGGRRMLRLYRIEGNLGELFTFPPSEAPILLHVLAGGGTVGPIGLPIAGGPHHLTAGDTFLVRVDHGKSWGFGGGGPMTAIAAVIGEIARANA